MELERVPKPRPRREVAVRLLDPPARVLVRILAAAGTDPLWVVTWHGLCGLAAAALIAAGGPERWPWAAGLLFLKALLDNVDGGLARATGRVTRAGRYFDTGVDALANVALFAALAPIAGPLPSLAALLALTAILSADHNLERLYRVPRSVRDAGPPPADPPAGAPRALLAASERLYGAVLAPQDRAIERWDRAAFERIEGTPFEEAPLDRRLAWSDHFSVATVTDLGLSSQTLLLAALLAIGRPDAYPAIVLAMFVWVLVAQGLRVARYRAYVRADPEERRAGP